MPLYLYTDAPPPGGKQRTKMDHLFVSSGNKGPMTPCGIRTVDERNPSPVVMLSSDEQRDSI